MASEGNWLETTKSLYIGKTKFEQSSSDPQ